MKGQNSRLRKRVMFVGLIVVIGVVTTGLVLWANVMQDAFLHNRLDTFTWVIGICAGGTLLSVFAILIHNLKLPKHSTRNRS